MSLKQRIYVQFLIAILPLALVVLYEAYSRNDLPQRVNAALKSYDLALESSNAFKDFLNGVADAIDSGKIASSALEALRRAKAGLDKLAEASEADRLLAQRVEQLLAKVSAHPSIATIMPLKDEVQSLRAALSQASDGKRQALTSLVEEGQEIIVAAGFAALALVGFTVFVLHRLVAGITRPLAESVAVANAIAGGRLDNRIRVSGNDEITQLLRAVDAMQQHLAAIVRSVRSGARSVALASETLSTEVGELAHRSDTQAASLEQAAANMDELSGTVKENSGNAKQANELARGAAQAAAGGGSAMNRVVGTMQEITASSRRIHDIVDVIDGITFQTNILALNAAVEAARAGEYGRGFAVVAAEVRNLSKRCATAATEIRELIAASVEKIDGGGKRVDEVGRSIAVMVTDVERVSALMNDIATASLEQERGIAQVSAMVTEMDGALQQNATAVQRSAAASERLKRDAQELAQTVSRFRLAEDSEASAAPAQGERALAPPAFPRLRTPQA